MPAPVLQFKRGNAGVAGTVPALRPGEPAISLNNFDFFIGIDTSVANNKFFGSHRYWTREDGTNSLKLNLVDKDGTNYIAIKSPNTLAGIVTYQLPGTQGTNGTVLTNDGSGNLTWASGSNNPVFTGIATFTDTTDNTLGDPNTGAVQIDGGLGVNKNVTIGAGLSVGGQSYFIGTATFYGGTINLGDGGDIINIDGTINSNLVPTVDNTYDVGISTLNWRNAHFSGIGTFESGVEANNITIGVGAQNTVTTSTGKLTLNSATGLVEIANHLDIVGDLDVTGNVYIGGTTVTLRGTDVFIENKDIVLGYTTTTTPNDTTANHAGVAIASTEGTPLVSFSASGINTLPDTYKQLMWFKSGTLGFSTDAFAFNYGVAIGTTTMADGTRLAVGSGVTITDDTINAVSANFTNLSATNITGSLTGTISTATRATTVDTTSTSTNTNYHLVFTDNATSTTGATMRVDAGIYYNPSSNYLFASQFIGDVVAGTIKAADTTTAMTLANSTGNVTFNGDIQIGGNDIKASDGNTNITLTSNTLTAFAGDIKVGGNDIQASDGTTALTLSTSTGNVKTGGDLIAGSGYLAASDGTRALYMYGTSGDVSFQGKAIVNSIRSATDSNNAISLSGRDVTLENNVKIVGITTIGTGVGVTQFTSAIGSGTTTSSVPTSSAVIDYVGTQIGNVDLTLSIDADTGGPSTVATSQTLTIAGTTNEVNTSVSGQTITVGLPDDVIVGTSLSAPTVRTNIIKSQNTGATVITLTDNDATFADDLTVQGNLYVQGSTTQIDTTSLTIEDRTIELGRIASGTQPTATSWDLAVLFNYGDGGAKKAGVVWEASGATKRFQFTTDVSPGTDGTEIETNKPQLTVANFAPIEISELWVNNSCTGGAQQVIGCVGAELQLQNITIDAGTF